MENNWINEIKLKSKKIYSQRNQDGVTEFIFENIGTTNKFCVEFGFNAKTLTGGSGSNVARLVLEDKWNCLLLDGKNENESINLYKEFLTFENIGDVFKKYSVPIETDYVSIDVDSTDLWLMKGLLMKEYRPRLISVEYNANFPLDFSYTCKSIMPSFIGDMIYGASLLALNNVAQEFNYSLIAVVRHLDLFFVRNDLLDIKLIPCITQFKQLTGNRCHGDATIERLKCLVEYPSMNPISDEVIQKFPQIFRVKK